MEATDTKVENTEKDDANKADMARKNEERNVLKNKEQSTWKMLRTEKVSRLMKMKIMLILSIASLQEMF